MRWRDWQQEIENCDVIIYYNDSKLYPISEWLHPGALPIGTGLKDDLRQDLPNLDWILRHIAWMGFRHVTVVSHEDFKGLDRFYGDFSSKLQLTFTNQHFSEVLKQKITDDCRHLLLLSGLIPTNSDFRHAFMLHRQRENTASLLTIRGLQFRVGIAEIGESKQITRFREKPTDKSMLINSNILVIDTKQFTDLNTQQFYDDYLKMIDGHGYSIEQIIKVSTKYLIDNNMLKSVELTGVSGDPWFMDLSQLENWVKLDHDDFIDRFSHLIADIEE